MSRTIPGWTRLAHLQRWSLQVVTDPHGVSHGIAHAAPPEDVAGPVPDVAEILTRSRALSPAERIGVYGYAYFARLQDCMREEFPVLQQTLGEELFDAFAAGYLQECPPESYTLFRLGAKFPDFLQRTRPALSQADGSVDWADFLIELARLEWIYNEVFDGDGGEWHPPLDVVALSQLPPESLIELRLHAVPCLRLVEFHYPVHRYLTAARRNEEVELPAAEPTLLAVTRQDFIVRHYELDETAFHLLQQLIGGSPLGTALATTLETVTDAHADSTRLHNWFRNWARLGFFSGFECGPALVEPERAARSSTT